MVFRKTLFALCITLFCFFSPLSFQVPLIFFAPFLVFSSSFLSLEKLLWLSFLVGVFVDFFSFTLMGGRGVLYLITSFLLLRKKKFFFEERPFYLAIFSLLFAFLSEFFRLLFLEQAFSFKNVLLTPFYFSFSTFLYAIIIFVPFLFSLTELYAVAKRWILLKKR